MFRSAARKVLPELLVSLSRNLAILALPKTGSSALEAAIRPHCDIVWSGDPRLKHMPLRRFDRLIRPELRKIGKGDIETFCLLREPLDWLGSWYRYRTRAGMLQAVNSTAGLSFEGFALAWLGDHPPEFARFGQQAQFVAPLPGNPPVTHMFRYEGFADAVTFLEERFGKRFGVEQRNVSPERELVLTPATRNRVEHALADEYALWHALASPAAALTPQTAP